MSHPKPAAPRPTGHRKPEKEDKSAKAKPDKEEGGKEKPVGKSLPNEHRLDHHRDKTVAVPKPGEQKTSVFNVGARSWTEPVHKAVNGFTHDGPAVLKKLTELERKYGNSWYRLRHSLLEQQKEIRKATELLAHTEFGEWLANGWYKAVTVTTEAAAVYNAGRELVEEVKGFEEGYKPFVASLKTLSTDANVFFSTSKFRQAKAAKTKKDFEDAFHRFKNLFGTSKELGEHLAKAHRAITVDEPPKELSEATDEYEKEMRGFPGEMRKELIKALDEKFKEVQKLATDAAIGDPYARHELSADKEKIRNAYKALHKATRYLHSGKGALALSRLAVKNGLKFNLVSLTATVVGNEHVASLATSGAAVLRAWASEENHIAEEDLSRAFAFLLVLNQQYVRANHAYWSVKTYRARIAAQLGVFLEPVKIDFLEAQQKLEELRKQQREDAVVARQNTRGLMND